MKSIIHINVYYTIPGLDGFKLPMDEIDLRDSSLPYGVVPEVVLLNDSNTQEAYIKVCPGINSNAMELFNAGVEISGWNAASGFGDIHQCHFGYTAALWFYVMDTNNVTHEIYIISSGAEAADSRGFLVSCNNKVSATILECEAHVTYNNIRIKGEFTLLLHRWTHLAVSWETLLGLKVFVNGHDLKITTSSSVVTIAATYVFRKVTLGYSSIIDNSNGHIVLDDIRLFDYWIPEVESQKPEYLSIRKIFGEFMQLEGQHIWLSYFTYLYTLEHQKKMHHLSAAI